MMKLRAFVRKSKDRNVKFIFVSNWMKNIMEKDTLTKVNNCSIIPNIIDSNIFVFYEKLYRLYKLNE